MTRCGGLRNRRIDSSHRIDRAYSPQNGSQLTTWGFAPDSLSLCKCISFSLGVCRGDISLLLWREFWEELCSVVGGIGFKDAVDGAEQFAGDGDEGLHLGFMARDRIAIEGLEVGVVLDGDRGWHGEHAAQVSVAGAADPGGLVDGRAGLLAGGIEAAVGHPLARRHLRRQQGQFAQQLQSADLGDAGDAGQQLEALADG